jgi:hypothetical protein
MKKFYIHINGIESGPFDIEELKSKNLTKSTSVWFDGLEGWTSADKVEELQILFQTSTPPPFDTQTKTPPPINKAEENNASSQTKNIPATPKKKSRTGLIVGLIILTVLICGGAMMIINNPDSIPGVKIEINTPKPIVVTSRTDGKKSGLFNARMTVYATIMNQGGNGNVLVTFKVSQGGKDFERSQSLYLGASESQDLEVTFEEVDYVSGDITYNVEAIAQ